MQDTAAKESIIYVEGVTVSFDGFKALNSVNFIMDDKELRVVIGPNGAGKTTLLDVITGKVKPSAGRILFADHPRDLTDMKEEAICQLGIGRKFQTPTIFGSLTVFENLELALKNSRGVWSSMISRLNAMQREKIDETLEMIGLLGESQRNAGALAHGQKQRLEIGMLVVQDPLLMLVDEPAAGMTDAETHQTGELLKKIALDRSVLVIDHDMEFVRQIASIVTVMHEGSVLCEGSVADVQNDPKVREVYLGRDRSENASD